MGSALLTSTAAAVPFASVDQAGLFGGVHSITDDSGTGIGNAAGALAMSLVAKNVSATTEERESGQALNDYELSISGLGLALFANAHASVPDRGYARSIIDVQAAAALRNLTTDTLHVALTFLFSAFNPGGDEIGASVDNLLTQFARFESQVSTGDGGELDFHACDTRQIEEYYQPSPLSCGVGSPDESELELFLTLAPGESYTLSFGVRVVTEASSVPEPTTTALLLSGLLALAWRWQRIRRVRVTR